MRRDVILCLGAAVVLRIAFWAISGRVIDSADAIHYIAAAERLAAGDFLGIDPKIPILYPLLGGLVSLFVKDTEFACRLVSLAASTLLVVPVYGLAFDLHGRGTARMAALTAIIWTWLIDYGSRISTEALACTLWFLAVWALARALTRGGAAVWLAPLVFIALHLARPEGLFLLLAALPAAALLCVGNDEADARRLVPFIAIAGVLLAAYAVYMRMLTGHFTLSYRTAYIIGDVQTSNAQRDVAGTVLLFVKTTTDTVFEVLPIMMGPVLLVFLGVGLFAPSAEPRKTRLEWYVIVFAAIQWAISLSVLSPAPRYLMATILALSLWSARGVVWLTERMRQDTPTRPWRWLPVASVVGVMAIGAASTIVPEHLGRCPRQPREYKTAGQWMKEHLEPGLIFTRKPQVGYYAGMPTTGPAAEDSVDAALARARQADARYFVVDERYTATMAPALAVLLDPANAPPGLEWLRTITPEYPGARVVIYAICEGP
ncbi:MAG TPA: glycosyltransferase family 39 protein [Candidatus Hydrogenedentes bacterium]|nr:glycosyltransferase family 39 protein [Candidatus Hydrogenedentota bacterium]